MCAEWRSLQLQFIRVLREGGQLCCPQWQDSNRSLDSRLESIPLQNASKPRRHAPSGNTGPHLSLEQAFRGIMGAATTITTVTKLKTQEGSEQRAPKPRAQKKMRETSKYKTVNCLVRVAAILNSNWLQTILYLVFVVLFQSLSQTMRMPQEYLVDKHVMDRLIENHFDSSHNTFNSVRRIPDIYEWGNNVLWPGLFADLGPCDPNGSPVGSVDAKKSCQDDVWPDGDGIFHLSGATPLGLAQLVERMDMFDWTEGLSFRQVRAPAGDCPTTSQLGTCYPEFAPGGGAREPFGYNHTHPSSPLAHPFKYFTAAQLGSNPRGMISAAIPSMATYETSGFVALVIPFFSDTFLKPEEGTATEVSKREHAHAWRRVAHENGTGRPDAQQTKQP